MHDIPAKPSNGAEVTPVLSLRIPDGNPVNAVVADSQLI